MATYLITVKPYLNGAYIATVTRQTATGIARRVASAAGATQDAAVRRVRRDVRLARVCGGLK